MIKRIIQVTIIIAAMAGILKWSAWRDEQVNIASDRYEKCVQEQYGVSPSNWYAEHGEYPTCETLESLTK